MNGSATLPRRELLAALPHLRRYAEVLMGRTSEADNLVAETLERAPRQSSAAAAGPAARARLFALMRELYAGHAAVSAADPTTAHWDAAGAPSLPQRASELLTQFGALPTEEREVLLLVAVERMRYEEIAELLRVPVSTVMARLKRARDFMRTV
jgi:RNA polymerase sigma-70 factor (ECF subfamily)